MRIPSFCFAVLALVIGACGPGASEVKGARTAHYKGDKLEIFHAARDAAASKIKIAESNEATLGFKTTGRWFNPEGQLAMDNASNSNTRSMVPDKSLFIVYAVGLKQDGDSWVVEVKPLIERFHAGSPQTEPLQEGDISLPGWVQGKTDAIAITIHDGLKQFEVKTVPGQVPAGNAPPASPPAGSAAPAEGSAAAPAP